MTRYGYLLTIAALAVSMSLSCPSTFAQVGGGGGGGGGQGGGQGGGGGGRGQGGRAGGGGFAGGFMQNPYVDQYNQMTQQLTDLTDDEKTKVKDDVDAMNKELDAFQQDAQQKIRQSMRGGGGGGGAGGGGQAAARDQIRQSMDDYETLADVHQIKIDADLTPDQKNTWETFKLNHQLEPRLTALGLDDDQKAKAKDDIDAAAKLIAAATDAKDLPPIRGQLVKKLVADVLTDAQAAKILTAPTGPAMGGRGGMGGGGGGQGGGANGGGRRGGGQGGGNGGNGNGGNGNGGGAAVAN